MKKYVNLQAIQSYGLAFDQATQQPCEELGYHHFLKANKASRQKLKAYDQEYTAKCCAGVLFKSPFVQVTGKNTVSAL